MGFAFVQIGEVDGGDEKWAELKAGLGLVVLVVVVVGLGRRFCGVGVEERGKRRFGRDMMIYSLFEVGSKEMRTDSSG